MRGLITVLACSFLITVSGIGCAPETRYRVLSFFLDGVPKPGEEPVPEGPKAETPTPAEELGVVVSPPQAVEQRAVEMTEKRPEIEQTTHWEEAEPRLPKDSLGAIDWIRAMEEGMIDPRSGLDPGAPALEPLLLDVELVPDEMPDLAVVFSHEAHTRLYTCEGCHPNIFAMQKGASPVTMERIFAGKDCGICHGTVAFPVEPNCGRCHRAMEGEPLPPAATAAAEARNYGDIVFERKGGAPDFPPAIFRHWVHRIRYRCAVCHPTLFEHGSGINPISMEAMRRQEFCGACHNGKIAWGISFESCHRCHTAQKVVGP